MIPLLLFFFSLLLAILSGVLLNSTVRHSTIPGWLLGLYIFTCSSLIIPLFVIGMINQFHPTGVLLAQSLFFAFVLILWQLSKKPKIYPENLVQSIKKTQLPILLFLFIVVISLSIFLNGVLSIAVPQNNFDAMTYHLARIGYWLQHQSLLPWNTSNFRQIAWPFNAELLAAQSILFLHSDRLTGLVQWVSYIFGIILVYSFSRLIGSSRPGGLFAAFVWATFPLVILESSTTQNDLVVASFLLSSLYFLILAWQKEEYTYFFPAGFAFGLALGTKLTVIFALPGVFLAILVIAQKYIRQRKMKPLIIFLFWFIFGSLILGSYTYIQNMLLYRYPFGPAEIGQNVFPFQKKGIEDWKRYLLPYFYQSIDFSGLPQPIFEPLSYMKKKVGLKLFNALNFSSCEQIPPYSPYQILSIADRVHEDFTWFGPLSFTALPISCLYYMIDMRRKRNFTFWSLLIIGLTYIFIIFSQGWTPHRQRYLIFAITALSPAIAWWFPRKKWAVFWGILALIVAYQTTLFNEAKPLVGENAIWKKNELELRTINYPLIFPLYQSFEEKVPSNSKVALYLGENGYDRLFFGEKFDRKILQSDLYINHKDISWLFENQIDYLVVGPLQRFFFELPDGLKPIFETEHGGLYKVISSYSSNDSEEKEFPLIYKVSDSLFSQIRVLDNTLSWGIEQDSQGPFAWIGQCSSQGLSANIFAKKKFTVVLKIKIEPGPSRDEPSRTILGVSRNIEGQVLWVSEPKKFNDSAEILMNIPLNSGLNNIVLYVLEPPNILGLPNGDTRPLLARIREIRIEKP